MNDAILEALTAHNTFATRVLLKDAGGLTAAQLHQRFDIGLGSIHDTLRHIIGAMLRWADRIAEKTLRPSIEAREKPFTPDELLVLLEQADSELRGVIADVAAHDGWRQLIHFAMPDGSATYRFTKATAIVHVMTHGMHHRAQVLNMRRQLGLAPLELDLDVIEWECVKTGQIVHDALG